MSETQSPLAAEVTRLSQLFEAAGAVPLTFDALQPARAFLDLYGEDIRGRAFITREGLDEMMLRPDFTVPVVARHMAEGAEPAKYTYAGPIWRKTRSRQNRGREFTQVGFELFDGRNTAEADAEVFALISEAVQGQGLSVATGDMGVLIATLEALDIDPARRAALRRHLWRPERFKSLLNAYARPSVAAEKRERLLTAQKDGTLSTLLAAQAEIGLRSPQDVHARAEALAKAAQAAPMPPEQVALLDAIFALRGTAPSVLEALTNIAHSLPKLQPALTRFEARLEALEKRKIVTSSLPFEVSFGRTTLEYYDGFVFGFFAENRPDLPVIASGGRYDALTRELGQGQGIPAVGGVVRPEALLALKEARA